MSNRPRNEEIEKIQLPPDLEKMFSSVKGQFFAETGTALDNAQKGPIFVIKSLIKRMQEQDEEIKNLKKKPTPKPTPKKK